MQLIGKHFNPIKNREVAFDVLALRITGMADSLSGYKVYQDATHFVLVRAETVSQALEKSGIENPVRVVLANITHSDILKEDRLREKEECYNRFNLRPPSIIPPKKPIPIEESL